MPNIELKPCPFCCGEAQIGRKSIGQRKALYRIECRMCLIYQSWYGRLKDAVEAWNRRAHNEKP